LHDVHTHSLEMGDNVLSCLLTPTNTLAQHVTTIQACQTGSTGWILGWGYNVHTLVNVSNDPTSYLDQVSIITPIAIMSQTSHSMWVNTAPK
jgi:predicted amidohydrolase YtcJ